MKVNYCRFLGMIIVFFAIVVGSNRSYGQGINMNDLSSVNVDELSDAQIRAYMKQAESSGLSEMEMEQMAAQRGMPASEIQKLRTRIEELRGGASTSHTPVSTRDSQRLYKGDTVLTDSTLQLADSSALSAEDSLRLRIFGAELFSAVTPTFEPNLQLPTPRGYIIGPGDQILVDIYGRSEQSHSLAVSPEGNINIPYVGIVAVSGLSIDEATDKISRELSNVYSAIRSGATRVNVSLGNIRSIKVILTGEIERPGTYTLPSVATPFNALYFSGGPTVNGSFRDIRLIRNGKVVAYLDIYDILMKGTFDSHVMLQDQDVLMVPPYINRVEFEGAVKRPNIFETKEGETFADLLAYAGGFREDAYQARIKVVKYTNREQRIEDLLGSQFSQYLPQSGDKYIVERVLKRFENRVAIHGSVFRPGDYELSPGLTLSMLIKKAEGLREDAFLNRGYIRRLKDDFQTEQLSFSVSGILAGTEPDIELRREDVVTISSIFDLREAYIVEIDGEVRMPGQFAYAEGMTLQSLIMQAGGFRESATANRIEVSRQVKNADALSQSARIAEVFQIDADKGLSKSGQDFVLMPFDKVIIRTAAGYETQRMVRIEGEVLYPGLYTITRKDERVSDIIKRAGGFTPYAHIDGASLKRGGLIASGDSTLMTTTATERIERESQIREERSRMQALQQLQSDVGVVGQTNANNNIENNYVGINLEQIIKNPGNRGDLILEDGDIIRVPKELQTVKISGEVLAPSTAVYSPSKGFKQYISQAGGFSSRALRKSSYVLYANGSVKSTNRFLFFNNYPPIKPGAEIFVPQREVKPPMTPQQWLGMGTGLASLGAIIISLFR
ncbi:polysaccharide biosynthesis/export family protein [Parapedobacter koreensis]|uniref:Protein involved in polysaccharide export, contains SLBB domain of the beta-grasp fold n=1 Tax=Parapedobacter koreensis TaxID=332977 RepID=A0A1H7RH64_9SPHI|nr:SLBB domain-containing protein [Parapedobacter koreensis]SEL59164.1 protein involved in polysaccharide export, contains SLBB domain of the beta-grasp fold [Parapedobacter koreensis]